MQLDRSLGGAVEDTFDHVAYGEQMLCEEEEYRLELERFIAELTGAQCVSDSNAPAMTSGPKPEAQNDGAQ